LGAYCVGGLLRFDFLALFDDFGELIFVFIEGWHVVRGNFSSTQLKTVFEAGAWEFLLGSRM